MKTTATETNDTAAVYEFVAAYCERCHISRWKKSLANGWKTGNYGVTVMSAETIAALEILRDVRGEKWLAKFNLSLSGAWSCVGNARRGVDIEQNVAAVRKTIARVSAEAAANGAECAALDAQIARLAA